MLDLNFGGALRDLLFKYGSRGFGYQRLTIAKCRELEDAWHERRAKVPPTRSHLELYDRLIHEGTRGEYSDAEMRRIVSFVFFGCGPDRPALFCDPVLVEFTGGFVERHAEDRMLVKDWCRSFYRIWPREEPVLRKLLEVTRKFCAKTEDAAGLIRLGWMEVGAPVRIPSALRDDQRLDEYVGNLSRGLIDGGGAFVTEAWRRGFDRYSRMVKGCRGNVALLQVRLAVIEGESTYAAGGFRDLNCANDFVRAVLDCYWRGSGLAPLKSEEDVLWRFFHRIFGESKDPNAQHIWSQIDKELRELIEHWRQGRALIGAFDLIGTLVRKYPAKGLTGPEHWMNRGDFWRSYWNGGHVSESRVYVARRHFHSQEVRDYSSRGVVVSDGGSMLSGQCVLTMVIGGDEGVLVMERNFSGALFIVDLKRHPEMKRYARMTVLPSYWTDDFKEKGERQEHRGNWKSPVRAVINRMLGYGIW